MLNVIFQLNSKTTHFQTYIYTKFLLSFNVKISLLKCVQEFLIHFIYIWVTSCNGRQVRCALRHELLQTFPSLQYDTALLATFLMFFTYCQGHFTVFTVTFLSYCKVFMPTSPEQHLNSSSFFILYYGTYTLPNG